MKILIENLTFDAIIGILDFERTDPQQVQIDCTIDYTYTGDNFINYADIACMIETTVQTEQFELIETALEVLAAKLKLSFPLIDALSLTFRKPNILPNCTVGVQKNFIF
ncbi:dihydroneopterin aldolase [Sulfuricurvum kujiense DSM 16994]|uniref:Dihydroneopterin aldolase n=1 Tax=Sulfuricurvum kujiense (strain ATCC BAA-921 / DSM 16994 / JCM 11577 / YK-1) TaxID=709032 RepID=E4TZL6_SULKY|nr:dihydroneopterin aldolase [Sulfuricurvum kujiense]ADR33104.1 dihydroneopterin aldolase [Sulfuricurvum kujiense DSM 16994]